MEVDGTGNSSSRSGDHLRPPAQSGNVDDDRDLSQSGVMSRAQQKRPTPTQLTATEQETCLEDLQQLLEEIEGRNYELSELMDETSAILLSRTLAVCCTSDKTAEKSMELTSRLIKAILKALPAFYGHRSSKDTHPPWVFENQWKAHGEAFENLLWLIGCGIVNAFNRLTAKSEQADKFFNNFSKQLLVDFVNILTGEQGCKLSHYVRREYIACIFRSLDSKRCKKNLRQNDIFGSTALETLIAHAHDGATLEYTFKIIWRAFFVNKPGSDPDNLKVFDAIFTAKSVTKPPCLEALRKIWSSIPPVYSKMEKMIPSFIGCLAREGYERVQTIKIGSSIEQDGADLRAVHPEKGFAELCINAKTLTVSINGTMVGGTAQRGIWEASLTSLASVKVGSAVHGSEQIPIALVFHTRPTFENQALLLPQGLNSRNATEVTFAFMYEEAVDELKDTLARRYLPLLANKGVLTPGTAAEPAETTSAAKSAPKSGGSAVPAALMQAVQSRSPIFKQSPIPAPKASQPLQLQLARSLTVSPEPDDAAELPAEPRHSNAIERQEAIVDTYFNNPDTSRESSTQNSDGSGSMKAENTEVAREQASILPAELTSIQPLRSEPAGGKGQQRGETQTQGASASAAKQPETQKHREKEPETQTQTQRTQGGGRRSRTSQMPWNKVNAPNKAIRPDATSTKPVSTDTAPVQDHPRPHPESREASAAVSTARDTPASGHKDAEPIAATVAHAAEAVATMDLSSSDDELSDLGDAAHKLADATMRLAEKITHAAESLQPADKPKKTLRDGDISATAAGASATGANDQDRRNKRPSPPDDDGDRNGQTTRTTPALPEQTVETQEESEHVHPPKKTSVKRQRVDSPLPSQREATQREATTSIREKATATRQAEKSNARGEKEADRSVSRKGESEQDTSADMLKRTSKKDNRDNAADGAKKKRKGRDSGIDILPNHRARDADEEDEWLDEQSRLEQVSENDGDTDYDLPISKTAAAKKTATAASKTKVKPKARPSAKGKVVRETATASKAKTAAGKKDKKVEVSVDVPSSTPQTKRVTRSTRSGDADISMSSDAPSARASVSNKEHQEGARQTRSTRSKQTPAPAPAAITQSTSRSTAAKQHENQHGTAQDPALDVPLLVQDLTTNRTMTDDRTAREAFQTDSNPTIGLPLPLSRHSRRSDQAGQSGHAGHSTTLDPASAGTSTIPLLRSHDADPSVVDDALNDLLAGDNSPPFQAILPAGPAQTARHSAHPLQRDESFFDKYMNLPADEAGPDGAEPANFDTDMAHHAPAIFVAPLAPPAPESIAESVEYVRETERGCAGSAHGEDTSAFKELAPPSSPGTNTFASRADYVSPALRSRRVRDSVGVLSSSPAAKSAYDALESLTRAQEEEDDEGDLSAGEERNVRGGEQQGAPKVAAQRDEEASMQADMSDGKSHGQATETQRAATKRQAGTVAALAVIPREPLGRKDGHQAAAPQSAREVRAPSVQAVPPKHAHASIALPAKENSRDTPLAVSAVSGSANLARTQRQAQREQLAAGSALAPGSSAQSAPVSRSALPAQLGTHNIAPKRDMPRYAQAMPAVAGAMPSLDVQARSGQQSHRYRMDRAYVNIELDGNHQQERPLRRRERQQGAVSAPARAVGMQQPHKSDHRDESAHRPRTMQAPARSVQTRFADDDAGMLEGDTLFHDAPQYQQQQPQMRYSKAGPVQQPGSRFDADMMSIMHKMNGILLDSLHRNLDAYGSGRDASIEAIVNTVEAGFKEAEIADLSLVKRYRTQNENIHASYEKLAAPIRKLQGAIAEQHERTLADRRNIEELSDHLEAKLQLDLFTKMPSMDRVRRTAKRADAQ